MIRRLDSVFSRKKNPIRTDMGQIITRLLYAKKIIYITIIVLLLGIVTGCSSSSSWLYYFENEDIIFHNTVKEVFKAIDSGNKERLKTFFADAVTDEKTNFDTQVIKTGGGKDISFVANGVCYYVYMQMCTRDDFNMVGKRSKLHEH